MDILLAVFIFLVTAATGYLGVRVTLHPAETDREKAGYKIAFAVLTFIAAGLIAWQTAMNRTEQEKLNTQLNKIQKNTETPPQVTVNPEIKILPSEAKSHTHLSFINPASPLIRSTTGPLPLRDGDNTVNIAFQNVGNSLVQNCKMMQFVSKYPYPVDETKIFRDFLASKDKASQPCADMVPTNSGQSATALQTFHVTLGKNDVSEIESVPPKAQICALARTIWTDESGRYQTDACKCFRGDNTQFVDCFVHNNEVRLK